MPLARTASVGFLKPRLTTKLHPKVQSADLLSFFHMLSTLFRAGIPIYEALAIAGDQSQSTGMKALVASAARRIESGATLWEAFADHPKVFKPDWIEIVKSGEASGKLDEVLDKLTEQVRASNEMRAKLVSAMIYPTILSVVATSALVVMLVKVVPTFAEMFAQMDKELPAITQYVLAISHFLTAHFGKLFGGLVAVVLGLRAFLKTPAGRDLRDRLALCLPMIGDITVEVSMQKFANNIAMLQRAGVPLLDTIDCLKGVYATSTVYREAMGHVVRYVGRGGTLSDAIKDTGLFTSFLTSMVTIGEQSGTLPEVMDEVDKFYRGRISTVLERVTGAIEMFVVLFMGVAVAGILFSVYMPMFSMASGIG
ncbi:MAG: type II secretion system F family protein [Planctomycetes bacterium]|nr:type II secretion system F family protein [Planctomycetota bacterium]